MKNSSLTDRFDLSKSVVLLNGTQALVRLLLTQKARDKKEGLNTAGLVTGYRGSPLGAVDSQMAKVTKELAEYNITFQPGLNEDLSATLGVSTGRIERRGAVRWCFWVMVWQRTGSRSFRRRNETCKYGWFFS